MFLTRTVAPVSSPVTLAEAKEVARIDTGDDDSQVQTMIDAAARLVGEEAGRVLTEETWAYSFPSGYSSPCGSYGDLVLPKSPVKSVSSITYYDADDAEQTATVSDFYLMKGDDRAVLRPKSGASWPSANANRGDAITVTFVAGYSAVPETLKHAVLMMVAHLYDHRHAVGPDTMREVPLGIRSMINAEKLGWIAG